MKKILVVMWCIFMIFSLTSCGDVVSNRIDAEYLSIFESNGDAYIKSTFSDIYHIDFTNKTFSRTSAEHLDKTVNWSTPELFIYEFFAGEYIQTIPTGYDAVLPHIDRCKIDDDRSVIYAYGQIYDNFLIGYIQVYNDTSGVHGNYAIEKISHSILFKYDSETDAFTIIDKIDDVVAVAVHRDTVIYWKNKAYYLYDLHGKAESLLTEDKAYDSGLQQQSWTAVLSNDQYCVIHFNKVVGSRRNEYMYIFDYITEELYELTYIE